MKSPPDTCVGIAPEKEYLLPQAATIGQMTFGINLNDGGGLVRFKINSYSNEELLKIRCTLEEDRT